MIYDVIIVGAGPAGGMTARILSKKGYSVLVIDKKKKVGYPIQCGEVISKFGLKNSKLKPCKEWVKKKHKGIKIFVPDGNFFFSFTKSYSIDRAKFDQWLIKEAIDYGCKLLLKTNASGIRKKKLWHVKTDRGIFKSHILVGADGPEANIASWLNLLRKKEFVTAIQYKFKSSSFPENEFLCMFLNARFKNGYAWVFPRGDEFNVGVGGIGNIGKWLDDFCKSNGFDLNKKISVNAGIIPKNYTLKNFVKQSALIVGDAAGLTNPLFGGGIHAALFSGKLAGETICKTFEFDDISLLKEYEDKLRNSPFCNPILKKAGEIFYSFKNEELNFIGYVYSEKDWRKVSYLEIFLKFLLKPKFFLKIKDFWIVKKGIELSEKTI